MFFVSNRDGGLGNRDIWFVEKNKLGQWSSPVNCGKNVNTSYDEMSPFIHWDNEHLYFASKGHPGLGGYDLFVSKHVKDQKRFSKPKNLEFPVNSCFDDNSLVVENDGIRGYYVSEQITDSILHHDFYQIDLHPEFQSKPTQYLFATVSHSDKQPLEADIQIKRLADNKTVFETRSVNGHFYACLSPDVGDGIFVSEPGILYFLDFFLQYSQLHIRSVLST